MKKLLLGSAALTLFSISIAIFQISCQKDATAQTTSYTLPPATISTLGGIIVGSGLSVNSLGVLSTTSTGGGLTQLNKLIFKKVISGSGAEIWTAKYDGTSAAKVNISLPGGVSYSDDMSPVMSPDGTKIFFTAGPTGTFEGDLYTCNADGSNVTKIVDRGGNNNNIILGGAY
jgi:hypothetical protein